MEPEYSDLKDMVFQTGKSAKKTRDVVMMAELKDEAEALIDHTCVSFNENCAIGIALNCEIVAGFIHRS